MPKKVTKKPSTKKQTKKPTKKTSRKPGKAATSTPIKPTVPVVAVRPVVDPSGVVTMVPVEPDVIN